MTSNPPPDTKTPVVSEGAKLPLFYVDGQTIFKRSEETRNPDGKSSNFTLGFPVCEVSEYTDPYILAEILCRSEAAARERQTAEEVNTLASAQGGVPEGWQLVPKLVVQEARQVLDTAKARAPLNEKGKRFAARCDGVIAGFAAPAPEGKEGK